MTVPLERRRDLDAQRAWLMSVVDEALAHGFASLRVTIKDHRILQVLDERSRVPPRADERLPR